MVEVGDEATAVLEASPLVVFAFDADGRCTMAAGGGMAALGLEPGRLVGADLRRLYGGDASCEAIDRCLAGLAGTSRHRVGDRAVDVWTAPLHDADGVVVGGHGTALDVTAAVRRELDLQQRAEGAATMLRAAKELAAAGIDRSGVLQRAAELSLDLLPGDAAVVYVVEEGRSTAQAVADRDPERAARARAALGAAPLDLEATGLAHLVGAGDPVVLGLRELRSMAPLSAATAAHLEAARCSSCVLIPLPGEAAALLAVARCGDQPPFTEADVPLAAELAGLVASSLHAASRHRGVHAELEVRRQNEEAASRQAYHGTRRAAVMSAIAAAPPEDSAVAGAVVAALGGALGRPLTLRLLGAPGSRSREVAVHHPVPEREAALRAALAERGTPPMRPDVLAPILEGTTLLRPTEEPVDLPPPFDAMAKARPTRELLFVPVRARDRVVGLLTTWAGLHEPPFLDDDVRLIEEVAERAGLALDNARLVAEARRRAHEQAVVADLSRRALGGRSLGATFAAAAEAVAEVLDATSVAVLELAPGGDEVILRAGHPRAEVRRERLASCLWTERSIRGRQPVLVATDDDGSLPPGARSGTWATISDGTQVVGCLRATSAEPQWFGDGDGRFLHAVATVLGSAMTRRAGELALRHQADHDALTGLPNRRHLARELEAAVAHGCALLLMDLDRFKEVNDTLGHGVGDELLITVGERIRRAVGGRGLTARLGGDEFAVLVHPGALEDGVAVAEAVADALDEPLPVAGSLLWVRASIGVAAAPLHGDDAGALLRHADVAMYDAKARARPVAVYDPARHEDQRERLDLAPALRRAIAGDALRCRFQPQIDLTTGRVRSFEALVRWQHEERGLLAPAAFIDLAEHTGLIRPLTQWVLHEALEQEARWLHAGLDVSVSVNLSPRMLHEATLVDEVRDALAAAGVSPDRLILELTETAMLEQPVAAMDVMEHLAGGGVRLSIDDFGTGYSSLSYLQRLPFAEIKVDRSFVTAMADSPGDQAIVEAVVGLAHSLGVEVVAEGIETEHVLRLLRNLGCDLGQGYHLGLPVPAAEASGLLVAPGRAVGA